MRRLAVVTRNPHNFLCRRGSKNYDWYYKQLDRDKALAKKLEKDKRKPLLPNPVEPGFTRPVVFMDLVKGDEDLGRIEFELAADLLPQTAENFVNLCTTPELNYKGTIIHRVAHKEYICGGDITMSEGCGNYSSFGTQTFPDEGFLIDHRAGILSMANSGVDTNGSQFFITLKDGPHLNGRNVAFGAVTAGMETLLKLGTTLCIQGAPVVPIVVKDCGVIRSMSDGSLAGTGSD